MTGTAEIEHHIWYCRRCSGACRAQPADIELACKCKSPVMPIRPTRVTQVVEPPPVRMHALSERETQLRSVVRKGRKVRITFEAVITDAWLEPSWENGRQVNGKTIVIAVEGPGSGQPVVINTKDPSVIVEAVAEETA
jgi:hypothetical protein